MPNPLKVAILGVGRWGVHLVRNFLQHPQAQVVAIADQSDDRLQALTQRFDLSGVTLTTDWQTAMTLPEVEAIVVVTPAVTHYDLIQFALQQGHHVLAEKPLTLKAAECAQLCQLAAQQQRQLVIDHTYLFHSAVRQGRESLASGAVGNLRYGYATRTHLAPVRLDVDALWDLAIHDIAIFNDWLNAIPVQVQAQGTVWLQSQPISEQFPQGLSDLVWLKLTYANGFQAVIHLCWCNPDKQRRLCVVGDRGTLIFDELSSTPLVLQQGRLEQVEQFYVPAVQSTQVIPVEPAEPLRQVCDHFIQCVQQNVPSPISSGKVGTELVSILEGLTRSLNQGGVPVDLS